MSLNLLSMLSKSFETSSLDKDSHTYHIVAMTLSADLNTFFCLEISLFIFNNTFSIWLRSLAGEHSIFWIYRFSRYVWVKVVAWGLALSSMKEKYFQSYFSVITGIRLSTNTETYFSELLAPLTGVKVPIPAPVSTPHHDAYILLPATGVVIIMAIFVTRFFPYLSPFWYRSHELASIEKYYFFSIVYCPFLVSFSKLNSLCVVPQINQLRHFYTSSEHT